MNVIKMLSGMIEGEIKDAGEYVSKAILYREERPELARLLYALSLDEMGHMQKLHTAVAEIIQDYREKNGEPPPAMLAVYDYLHERHIEEANAVKAAQASFR